MVEPLPSDSRRNLSLRTFQGPLVPGGYVPVPKCWDPDQVDTGGPEDQASTPSGTSEKAHWCQRCDFPGGHPSPTNPILRSIGYFIWKSTWKRWARSHRPGSEDWWKLRRQKKARLPEDLYTQWLRADEELESSSDSD